MTEFDPTIVTEGEHGLVRVFHYIPDPDSPDTGDLFAFIKEINVGTVADTNIQRVVVNDLNGMLLSDFLGRAYAIEQDKLDPCLDQLDALNGTVFVVRSSAITNRPATFNTSGPAKLVATFAEPGVEVNFVPLPDESAKRPAEETPEKESPKKPPSDAAMSGRIATLALLVMGLLVWLMIWVAG